jgi:hypothetical protein
VTAAVATFRHCASGNWRWRSPEDLESSTAFEWLQELTELSKRVESEKIEQLANSERSGVPSHDDEAV